MHSMTGNTDRQPILVGIGTATRRDEDWQNALEPIDLLDEAVRAAGSDCGVPAALASLEYISVPRGRWKYRNPAGTIARRVGATRATTVLATPGVLQQTLIGEACQRIARGEIGAAIIAGSDAGYRLLRAQLAGVRAPETPSEGEPDILMQPKDELRHPVEVRSGVQMPVGLYALLESAFRRKQGWSINEHRDRLAELYARLARVTVDNPHAWNRVAVPAAEIRDGSKRNPMQAFPYTRYHCSTWNVDQAAAILLCSVGRAKALGISPSRWVFPVASSESNHMVPVSARGDLSTLHGARIAGQAALAAAGLAPDAIDLVELYSCFPIAVELYADALGLPLTRDLTVTGGMAFAGGPYNNYFLQATCRAIELLREGKGSNALLSCVSGIVTKQAFAVWSIAAPAGGFAHLDVTEDVARAMPVREVHDEYTGNAVVAGCTVLYGRDKAPKGLVLVDTPDGRRAMATTEDAALVAAIEGHELVGGTVEIRQHVLTAVT